MEGALERVLRLVEEGRLTADEAGPILDALTAPAGAGLAGQDQPDGAAQAGAQKPATTARIEVREHGRKVIDLRVPISLGKLGLDRIPGLSRELLEAVTAGIAAGRTGLVLDDEDADGDGVRIILE